MKKQLPPPTPPYTGGVQVFHLYIADVPVYINDDGYGDGCFASGNPDGEQGEEKAFQLF